ncbi:MAG: YjjG family noncanonical pyrimidine nucleotidase [Eubacteriales bacterium]
MSFINKYKYILWDIDDTLINFKKSEKAALQQCFAPYDIILTDAEIEVYSEINKKYWSSLEKGLIDKPTLLVKRFEELGAYLQKTVDAVNINKAYQLALGDYVIFNDGALELCTKLQKQAKQYAVTNGTAVAQDKKLRTSGLIHIMDDVFISDKIGYEKPDIRFFEYAFAHIPGFKKEEAIIIGDSLTSDMQGGNNSGIACCWYNPKKLEKPDGLRIEYIISDLHELE